MASSHRIFFNGMPHLTKDTIGSHQFIFSWDARLSQHFGRLSPSRNSKETLFLIHSQLLRIAPASPPRLAIYSRDPPSEE